MTSPFVVLSLPRSRSYWVSRFLSYGTRSCDHDPARHFTSRADAPAYFSRDGAGAVDTSLGLIWAKIADQMPADLRVLVIHRGIHEVAESLRRLGFQEASTERLRGFAEKLWAIPGLHLSYSALDTWQGCRAAFEWCRQEHVPSGWWAYMKDQHLECDRAGYMLDTWNNRLGVRAVFGPQEQVEAT